MTAPFERVDVTPDTPAWLTERLGSLGASEVPAVLGSGDLDYAACADRIIALARPVAGVTLTPEEAAVALAWEALISSDRGPERTAEEQALVDRLEAAQ